VINGRRVLAVVPARGGSREVPRKNIRLVGGKPLIAYTLDAARTSRYVDRLVVSTEDAEIRTIAESLGAEVLPRPAALARDDTPGVEPVLHALDAVPGFGCVVLLQPTSPLRTTADIDATIEHWAASGAPVCVSVCEARDNPYRVFTLKEGGRLARFMPGEPPNRRQDLPSFHVLNGAVYVADTAWLRREKRFVTDAAVAFVMPMERSLDIDTERDLALFEFECTRLSAMRPEL
jgi:N-acylneuraminate cytidylyltransferase